ncbi:membrane protein [Longispora fulva]|uniref:Outer membrane lipoprotein-sorting protein n=1 Tax=Longispora fulva TaxID=619741 RepID=A0A8J7GD22_9ACTN|nr:hypothetical protein [Longispora fulva]MBG6135401.1 outer membrane lipoprotein-sorting protein [Longispora fulva]GIG56356.1 membrane protein [Longispora fulva]
MTDNRLRWAVPVGIVTTVAAVVGFSQIAGATDAPDLPKRTASQLLVDLQNARLDALSGTVVQRADLGLPAIAANGSDFTSLVSGNHTLKVWYAGPDKVRLALLGTLGESDVIRNGSDVWVWSSKEHRSTHTVLSADQDKAGQGPLDPRNLPKTPQEAADRLLASIDPSTVVTTASNVTVAGRSAYDLILAPRDRDSLVGSVHVAVDGERHVPLRVQVFAKNSASAAFEVGFQQVSFDRPGAENFAFTPPPGTEKSEAPDAPGPDAVPPAVDAAKPVLKGTGWTTVVVAQAGQAPKEAAGILGQLPKVSGDWGSGRLLSAKLFSVLLTDDGRLIAGAVAPQRLYEAAR